MELMSNTNYGLTPSSGVPVCSARMSPLWEVISCRASPDSCAARKVGGPASMIVMTTEVMTMAPPKERKRRFHRRSKNGCQTCKRRHVRCDEQKPLWYVLYIIFPVWTDPVSLRPSRRGLHPLRV